MAIRFENLPLFEVTLRLTLREPVPVGFPLVLDLFQSLGDVVALDNAMLEAVPGAPLGHAGFGPAAALGLEGGCSVHLQPYLLATRWRGIGSDFYVGFAALRDLASRVLTQLRDLLGVEPPISVVNMNYSNFIAGNIRPMIKQGWLPEGRGTEVEHWETLWHSADHDLRLAVDRGLHETLGGDGFVLLCAAGKVLGESEAFLPALERIHELLCNNFIEMITDEAKEQWQYKNE